jgi:hypothetical protein
LEIKEYVGALAGKGRIVAAVAIIAGFLAVVVFIFQPQKYQATATVVLPIPPSTTTSALAAVSEAYADFSGALNADVVAQNTAESLQLPTSAIKGHLSVSRLSGGALAEVTYSGTDKENAPEIATTASQEALALLISARLAPLDQAVSLAQRDLDDARAALQRFNQETGIYDAGYFIDQQDRLTKLKDEIGKFNSTGDTEAAANLQDQFDRRSATVSQERAEFDSATTAVQAAKEALVAAQQAELGEKSMLDAAEAGGQVSGSDASSAPRLPGLIKAVVPAVVVATGLAIAMIVLLEVVGPVRLPARRRGGPGQPEWAAQSGEEARGTRTTAPEAAKPAPAKAAAPAKASAAAKESAPAKEAVPAKASGPANDAAPAKESAPATQAAPTKEPAPAKESVPAKASAPAKDEEAAKDRVGANDADEDEDEEEEPERDPAGRIVRSRA